ncbi:hypothetical protein [Streptomyces muensis]|uniref:Uncharacterized protein n=1 Tax=Streptomyces muensis TaxID=1077944 RepID=A0A9X1TJN1_STRM4|nr:hypothetical protein [Streptomyces muensis]MCF1593502.1 hypothetical protein [Streptomyces muensis]
MRKLILSLELKLENSATGEEHVPAETTSAEVLYSAEVRHTKGQCTLTINDHLQGSVEVYVVPKRAVQKLPFYLSMLRDKLA